MWLRRKTHIDNEKLDRFGEELLMAMEASSQEINTAANSPFLYRRIRVRIEEEERRRATDRNQWFVWLWSVKHAIPVLTTIAAITIGIALFNTMQIGQPRGGNGGLIIVNDELPALSSDEMIASFVGWQDAQQNQGRDER
ncbi:MAG: hypothetical protein IPM66_12270 [Acidobacteriota bacterium]|nr:MAG: hypothetical protein IPM66_12270 [Acidobacteriota bacterium]